MELYYSEKFNPEELALLGRAIGTVAQGTVIVGRDGRAISRYGKRAMVVGIVSTGSTIMDVRLIPLIALKDFAHSKGMPLAYVYYHGGVRVEVNGLDVDEVEAILKSRSFIEAHPNDIGATVYYPNALDDFLHDLFKRYNFKIGGKALVDAMNTPAVLFFPRLSEHFGFEAELINDMMTSYIPPKPKEVFLHKLNKGDYTFGLRFRPDGIAEFYKDGEEKTFTSMWSLFDYLKRVFK
ncbi:phosphomannomutase-related protein [Thermococcus kodakarensis KOD1]|uniref:Phosphomannomutase-related protein n=1 Tax=Thermococcus kodakarensis (strain ATCC BAA-918 / JCM 12380 / KOD1) TaxID=69014 RepID=Q68BJ5_THEKO|nr:phospho-sugar mutase [Thermococcus kodakarensis]WCN27378.1 phospho-sugar mutase [Thermococcus kodakarensis]WCN29668.1 phospho-sugar mutase [Thermococcus kodakarensis]BAD42441.1 phosphosugar mutase [Thermococcus kodakarensis KOD1]BAD85593.1 phosphomannomutase-related protein [Thermococcus kodakarensis KOD1]